MRHEWQSFGAWPWTGGMTFGRRFFESGEVRLAILSLLSDGPKHGYQLMKDLEERSGGLYKASAGSIYPTLQQLVDLYRNFSFSALATAGGTRSETLPP